MAGLHRVTWDLHAQSTNLPLLPRRAAVRVEVAGAAVAGVVAVEGGGGGGAGGGAGGGGEDVAGRWRWPAAVEAARWGRCRENTR